MTPASRDNNFNLCRLFGAVLVIYGHSYALTGHSVPGFAGASVSTVGVKIFFSISGYLVSRSWLGDPHIGRYFSRRALRIFPALICLILTTTFLVGPLLTRLTLHEYFFNPAVYEYLKGAALYIRYYLPGVFEHNVYPTAVNGSLWSLPAEFSMYIVTPLLLTLTSLTRRGGFIGLIIVLVALALWAGETQNDGRPWVVYATDVWTVISLAPYFLVGMALAAAGLDRLLNIYMGFAFFFMLAVFETSTVVKEAMSVLILPYATLSFAKGRNLLPQIGDVDVSYGVFLWGFLVQQALASFAPTVSPWEMFSASLALSVVLAYFSWSIVEKPVLGLKPASKPKHAF